MSIESIKNENRKIKGYKENSVSSDLEYICAVFTIIFKEMIKLHSDSLIEMGIAEKKTFSRNKITLARNAIFCQKVISFKDKNLYSEIIRKYFSNKNNGIYKIDDVKTGLSLLEEIGAIELPDDWKLTIDDWNARELGKTILEVWEDIYDKYNRYITHKSTDKKYEYSILKVDLDKLIKEEKYIHLGSSKMFYQKITNDLNIIRNIDVEQSSAKVDLIFESFIEEYCDSEKLSKMTDEEYKIFLDAVYCISDIFDKTKDDKSYRFQVILLDSLNRRYYDNYINEDIEIIRKVIGFTYGLAICPSEKQSNINIKLTGNGNINIDNNKKNQTVIERLDICLEALNSIVNARCLKLGRGEENSFSLISSEIFDELHRVAWGKSKKSINLNIIYKLKIIAMLRSDIAAVHMNYLKINKNPYRCDIKIHKELAKKNHNSALAIRATLLKYAKKNQLDNKKEDELNLVRTLSNMASLFYLNDEVGKSIILRVSCFSYYISKGLNKLAVVQAEYAIKNMNEYVKNKSYVALNNDMALIRLGEEYYKYNYTISDINELLELIIEYDWNQLYNNFNDCLKYNGK